MRATKVKALRQIMAAYLVQEKDSIEKACIAKLMRPNRYGYISDDMNDPRNQRARQHVTINPMRQVKKAVLQLARLAEGR